MTPLSAILERNAISRPDGRPLHGYRLTNEDLAALRQPLRTRVAIEERLGSTAQGFVLWAAERIRQDWPGGSLTWDFVYQGLGLAPPDYGFTRWLVETGLKAWCRPLRRGDAGHREFLFSLLAEGGLPDAALAQANRYRMVLLGLIGALEAEGALAAAAAETAALRAVQDLPQVLRDEGQARLMADLALALIALRQALPEDLPAETAFAWLDAQRPDWRATLPLRLSDRALETIVRPALAAARVRPNRGGAPVRRLLLCDDAGRWHAAAEISEGAIVPQALLPAEAQGQTLRLIATSGASFLARPDGSGWRLTLVGGTARMALDPSVPVVLSAHSDGRPLGDVLLDPGLPAPDEAPGLWHPADRTDAEPEVLAPLTGRARTRAAQMFVLTPDDVKPRAGDGVTLGAPEPGPGGRLWPLAGRGHVQIGSQTIAIETGAEAGAEPARLMASGPLLPGLACADGTRVFLGTPRIWAAEGDGPMRPLSGAALNLRTLPRLLGGQVAEWVEGSAVLARLRLIVLPASLRLTLREMGPGRLRLTAEGLSQGWHLALNAGGDASAQAVADAQGRAVLELATQGAPGLVGLRLSDPGKGAALALTGLWPALEPRLIDPEGQVLRQDRQVALANLSGWRGHLPPGAGAVLMRLGGQGAQVGLAASGEVRLATHAMVLGQALALTGADGQVNLRLALGGETPRLSIARYDWSSEEAGPFRHLGPGRTRLSAVLLDDPARTAATEAEGRIDLGAWLGEDDGLWFVQGKNDRLGVMRPFVWAARPQPHSTREDRLARFAGDWQMLLDRPEDPGWERLTGLIAAVRAAGDCGALDQVQALARIPAAAVALLMNAARAGRAAALALESEAPIWWPLLPVSDWAKGLKAAHDRIRARLAAAGIEDAPDSAAQAMAGAAGEIVALRPELAAHLGAALRIAGLPPEARDAQGTASTLLPPPPAAKVLLDGAGQEAARRFVTLPQGVDGLRASILRPISVSDGRMDALLHAPLVAAETAAGLRPPPAAPDILRLIALRAADPAWFDAALPCALTLAMNETAR
ncbi:STY4851/ECs_5259 family protein [Tabrizicola sp. YIM 78059]|uniref:STY4851/ECs_5259 family protein n=1 Tax=Tabrizicola sp. YIM 78059 TaxID=2529861 RepID=UPI001B7D7EB3|nr:STY4851/ECs_5259 family protein [Tabrizicola sp. YIM 78059]